MARKRITVVLDDELIKKLHEKQAALIKKSVKSVSFSRVLNDTLRKGIKQYQYFVSSLQNIFKELSWQLNKIYFPYRINEFKNQFSFQKF